MSEAELVELLRTYGGTAETPGSLNWLAALIAWNAAVGTPDARSSLSVAQAENLEATSVGVLELADAIVEAGSGDFEG